MRKSRKKRNSKQQYLYAHFNPRSAVTEQYRTIRTNLQFAAVDEEIRTIVVTSTKPGEGKSTTISNIAIVMAQQGNRVLLIDADMRKPTLHRHFNIENVKGLTNILTSDISIKEAVRLTVVENLAVITSGPIPPNPAELLGSKKMEKAISSAVAEYDFVLFDAPPVLAVADAQILANQCDGVIMVIGSKKTQFDPALKVKKRLKDTKAKLLGAVLNQREWRNNVDYYYYGQD
jgi:capsular exopolysaccharide synthesis family protein